MEKLSDYTLLQGLSDEDLRLNLLHWAGERMSDASPLAIAKEATALFIYIKFGVLPVNTESLPELKETPVEKPEPEKVKRKSAYL